MDNLIIEFYVNETNNELLKQLIMNLELRDMQNFELEIEKNFDSDKLKSQDFPDGFLYFPFVVTYYKKEKQHTENDIFNSKLILNLLWSNNIPTIASCNFEEKLPEKGGYKSKNIPWL